MHILNFIIIFLRYFVKFIPNRTESFFINNKPSFFQIILIIFVNKYVIFKDFFCLNFDFHTYNFYFSPIFVNTSRFLKSFFQIFVCIHDFFLNFYNIHLIFMIFLLILDGIVLIFHNFHTSCDFYLNFLLSFNIWFGTSIFLINLI